MIKLLIGGVGLSLVAALVRAGLQRFLVPDDPWLLEHGHRLSHHYADGMEAGSVDHEQQKRGSAGSKRRQARVVVAHQHLV